jgi:hypothetical protein
MAAESIDALERSIEEIQTLSLIYSYEEDTKPHEQETAITRFFILSEDEFNLAQRLLELLDSTTTRDKSDIPTLSVEIVTKFQSDELRRDSRMHITLPPGYPDRPAVVSIVSVAGLTKSQREDFSSSINNKSTSLAGTEALMELIQYWQENVEDLILSSHNNDKGIFLNSENVEDKGNDASCSRLWIWVHHITNTTRRKVIVQEAKEMSLSGYLKHGYPGIVVVEGKTKLCDEYVQWIKGNKSRPGGFGRNWGHHVRGQVLLVEDETMSVKILALWRRFVEILEWKKSLNYMLCSTREEVMVTSAKNPLQMPQL